VSVYHPLVGPKFFVSILEAARLLVTQSEQMSHVHLMVEAEHAAEKCVFKTNADKGQRQILVCRVTCQNLI
jgi:hypothetical protein